MIFLIVASPRGENAQRSARHGSFERIFAYWIGRESNQANTFHIFLTIMGVTRQLIAS
jgi:hypothetical protein